MNLNDKLAEFEGLTRYTIGRTEYISQEFLGFPKGTKMFEVYDWFAKEFKKEILEVIS
jgi:hypothetical protein